MNDTTAEDVSGKRARAKQEARLRRRIGSSDDVQVRLDTRQTSDHAFHTSRQWEGLAAALVRGDERIDRSAAYAVLGGPGTGKTSLLLDTAVAYLRRGGDPAGLMIVTPSKEAATDFRSRLTEILRDDEDYAATGVPVRSVHSWAFTLLRAVAQRKQNPLPRLMTGADHDMMIRTLLRGNAEDGSGAWPDRLRPGLTLVGFARQLRDLLLRASERGVSPEKLIELGRRHDMDVWTAAGHFMRESQQIERLSGSNALNAADLLHRVLDELEGSAEGEVVLDRQRRNLRLLLIDDAHNLDPASSRLLSLLTVEGATTMVAGDADQCVFHFRGADEEYLSSIAAVSDHRIVLSRSHRLGAAAISAVNRLEVRLPAASTRVPLRTAADQHIGAEHNTGGVDLSVAVAPSATAERLTVADKVRRAHVVDGMSWDNIAVLVRTVGEIHALRRTLLSHGVPVKVDPTSVVLAEQPLVAALLLAVDSLSRPISVEEIRHLFEGPVGGADPVMVRRMERALAPALAGTGLRALEAVGLLVTDRASDEQRTLWWRRLGPRERDLLEQVASVLGAGKEAASTGGSVEAVLWAVWQATGLSTRLQTRALRGGTLGSQADRDLDAVMSLFDLAGDQVERTPAITLETFVDGVRSQELPTGGRDRRGVRPDAVEILPAHAAAGRQWEYVVVSGVQEDSWPAGPTVGGLFGQQELVDLLDRGIDPSIPVSRASSALAEERRLFLLSVSRATRATVVTAVESTGDDASVASRFLTEISSDLGVPSAHFNDAEDGQILVAPTDLPVDNHPRVLAMEPLVAELRDAVCDLKRPGHERRAAATNLATLADAGVFGADPAEWWGTAQVSSAGPAVAHRAGDLEPTVRISPTMLENLGVRLELGTDGGSAKETCDFAVFLGGLRGSETTEAMRIGSFIHALGEGFARGLLLPDAQDIVIQAIPLLIDGPEWTADHLTKSCLEAVERLHTWLEERAGNGRAVEVEQKLERIIGYTEQVTSVHPHGDGQHGPHEAPVPAQLPVILSGRADRLETAADGATTVIDFKTGKTAKTKQEAAQSPQLAAYQLLVSMQPHRHADGAMLVYPRRETRTVTTLQQGALSPADLEEFRSLALSTAARIAGPGFDATDACSDTEFACLCPACRAGEQVV